MENSFSHISYSLYTHSHSFLLLWTFPQAIADLHRRRLAFIIGVTSIGAGVGYGQISGAISSWVVDEQSMGGFVEWKGLITASICAVAFALLGIALLILSRKQTFSD